MRADTISTTRTSGESRVVARHVIQELVSGFEAMLNREDQKRLADVRRIVDCNHSLNRKEEERRGRTDAQFEGQMAADRCTARRERYEVFACQGLCRAYVLAYSGFFGTVYIAKRKSQAKTERIRALTTT